ANQQRSLLHSQQAECSGISSLTLGNSHAIVPNFQLEIILAASQFDIKIRSTSMAQNVCQYFLQDTKHCGRPLTTQFDVACIVGPVTLESRSRLELLDLPFNCGNQA